MMIHNAQFPQRRQSLKRSVQLATLILLTTAALTGQALSQDWPPQPAKAESAQAADTPSRDAVANPVVHDFLPPSDAPEVAEGPFSSNDTLPSESSSQVIIIESTPNTNRSEDSKVIRKVIEALEKNGSVKQATDDRLEKPGWFLAQIGAKRDTDYKLIVALIEELKEAGIARMMFKRTTAEENSVEVITPADVTWHRVRQIDEAIARHPTFRGSVHVAGSNNPAHSTMRASNQTAKPESAPVPRPVPAEREAIAADKAHSGESRVFSFYIGVSGDDERDLRKAFEQLEKKARELAKLVRSPVSSPATGDTLKAELRNTVRDSFQTRQKLQRAELVEFAQRLQKIQQSIETRDRIAEEIIQRRVDELLDPNLKWNSIDEAKSLEQSRAAAVSPDNEKQGRAPTANAQPVKVTAKSQSDNPTTETKVGQSQLIGILQTPFIQKELLLTNEQLAKIADINQIRTPVSFSDAIAPLKTILTDDQLKILKRNALLGLMVRAFTVFEVRDSLELTQEQVASIMAIQAKLKAQLQPFQNKLIQGGSPKNATEAMQLERDTESFHEDAYVKALEVLTIEQRKKWREIATPLPLRNRNGG